MRVETIADQLYFTTVRLEVEGDDGRWTGTSFVYAVETNAGTAHFLVTNKHVLEGGRQITFSLLRSDGDGPRLGDSMNLTVSDVPSDVWIGHAEPSVDVAVLPLSPILSELAPSHPRPFFKSVGPALSLTPSTADTLDSLEDVTFIGYPSGIFDRHNHLPVARTGVTATPISVDYEGVPAFLIDASVFPGSSGSPVFIVNRGSYTQPGGGVVVGSRVMFVGILAAVHVRQVEGRMKELPTRLGVEIDEPIDLGIVFKSWTVDSCIDRLLLKAGLTRIHSPVSSESSADTPADEALDERNPTSE